MTVLTDVLGKNYKARILFTYFDYKESKSYVVYTIEGDLLASSYMEKDGKFIINNDLTTREYDMIDNLVKEKLGGKYA